MDIAEQLHTVFGFSSFRSHQQEVIEVIMAGRDVFGMMSTGGGNSLCYQLPASLLHGVCILQTR